MPRHPLTDEQKLVAATRQPLIFVESVPGSGKTTVAAERFGVLRHAHHATDPRAILAVSFARSAVLELRNRTRRRWGGRTTGVPNQVTTMDGFHRALVEFLLRTGLIHWPGGVVRPRLIDSWARQRGANPITVRGPRYQRWELELKDDNTLALNFRAVDAPCWGMLYANRNDFVESLKDGICTHDEIRQIVGAALGRPALRAAIDDYLSRTFAHLVVDEAFDLNGLDARVVQRVVESGVGVTLVGDPWQALYEWRGARPDMVHDILRQYSFVTLPMHTSFRFRTDETMQLAVKLRAGQPATVLTGTGDTDVVLASEWEHLLAAGGDVIPLSFGSLDCQTDAAIALLLDEVARSRLADRALYLPEAYRCLRRDPESIDLRGILDLLRDLAVPFTDVMTAVRDEMKIQGQRRPSLPGTRVPSRLARLGLLRGWLTVEQRYVPGLSFHQAKGREWDRVDVALVASARTAIATGLDETKEDDRKLYVALTRGRLQTRVRSI